MFLILLKYLKPLNEVDQFVSAHRTFLDKYYQSGDLVFSGPLNPREGGVILARTKDKSILDKMISEDPFSIHQIAEYKILEFNPVKYSPDFSNCL